MNQSITKKLAQQKAKEERAKLQLSRAKAESKKIRDEIMIFLGEDVLKQLHTDDVELAFNEVARMSIS
ncbi:translation initiation factor IF-2 [Fructobacillus fructosus]|uniref:hypothetical protein n=2 Tax=Fructobacillus fructosus TaxID=1631 RepID=UPI0006751E8D|nr:hypothetical protein [Fructobacillus fructosus]KRN53033.1 hypothetical protein IV71_GL000590 [Fructobacillus fructosus KCTC 3544]GAP00812.1 translation initiation factor IF-2 [Fructobacillus fructosus]